jgi:hypothetical protein
VQEAETSPASRAPRPSVPRWAVGMGVVLVVLVLILGAALFTSNGTTSIEATGKIISASKVAGSALVTGRGEVVCVRDNVNRVPVCGVSPPGGASDPGWKVGECAHIRVTDHSFDMKIRHC